MMVSAMTLLSVPATIPSPPVDWQVPLTLGPFSVHTYALVILVGIAVALWLTTRRWVERGGNSDAVADIAIWAIPLGILGGRLYHVISTPGPYFGAGGNPWAAFRIWEGGLGIWGAVALGALGAWIGCRRAGVSFTAFLDSAAPGVLIAQAIGRLGNYVNQELFGGPTDLPWGLHVDPQFRPTGYEDFAYFHPTFLYELIWNLLGAALILYLDRRLHLWGGRVFWLYVAVYTTGRLWIENVRIDTAVHVGPFRINVWVSIAVLTLSLAMFWWLGRRQRAVVPAPSRHALAAVQVEYIEDDAEAPVEPSDDAAAVSTDTEAKATAPEP